MLFITNRVLTQGPTPINPDKSYALPRTINFDLSNNQAEQSVYFCDRNAPNRYTEIGSQAFFNSLKNSDADQILLYIHGYSSLPEAAIFQRTEELQRLLDVMRAETINGPRILVVPVIWPCDDDFGAVKDYFDDQKAADASAFAYMRLFEKFMAWRNQSNTLEDSCTKRINILAHSMGARVLRGALSRSVKYYQARGLPLIFRNTFLAAADVVNETLDYGQPGEYIAQSARNVVVYYASDDLALRASKVANTRNGTTSRRLGHTGPEHLSKVPKNVYAVDCDDFNTDYDPPFGHGYFATDPRSGDPGLVLRHMWQSMTTGRVPMPAGSRSYILRE
jgi:esterase/lipase superfamily enzyme